MTSLDNQLKKIKKIKKMTSVDNNNKLMDALGLTTIGLTIEDSRKMYIPLKGDQYNSQYNISTTNTLIPVNIKNHTNVSKMCNNINFDRGEKPTSQEEFKFPDGFPASKKIYVIGRIKTISDAEIKKYKNLVYLNLPANNDLVPWSIAINDLFLLCGYNNSFFKTDNKYKCKPTFSIMLIVDPENNATINQTQIDLDSFINYDKNDKNNLVYIHPPKDSGDVKYNYRTCNDEEEDTNKQKCFDHSPSVTFTEISLLTKYFNMNCYFLEGHNNKNYDLYFFYPKFCTNKTTINTTIEEFNKKNNNIQLRQVHVRKTLVQAQAQAQEKYLKYKKKYLELKKYSIQFL